jgi:hypothetical protein
MNTNTKQKKAFNPFGGGGSNQEEGAASKLDIPSIDGVLDSIDSAQKTKPLDPGSFKIHPLKGGCGCFR